tara:strand:+ start:850 stop:1269 length:420 start_codon:yes stop_codon:yes gene_type:complete
MEPIKKLFEKEFFSDLYQKKKEIDLYQNCLQKALPKNLSMAFKVSKYKKGVLYLSTPSNVYAHKLKLLSKKITTQVNKQLSEQSKITQIKINLLVINPEAKSRNVEFNQVTIKKMSNFSKKLSPSPLKKVLSNIIKKNS